MKKNTVLTALLLCLALMIAAFASCGKQTESKGASETEETLSETDKTTATDAPATTEEPTTTDAPATTKEPTTTEEPTEIITPLDRNSEHSAALDRMGYVPGMSEGDFISLIEAYKYEGIDIMHYPDAVPAMYDAENGFGFLLIGEPFSGSYEFKKCDDGLHAEKKLGFIAKTELDGLTLPFGIEFGDALATVLAKLSIDLDLQDGFVSDPDKPGTMTLFSEGRKSLKLTDTLLRYAESDQSSGKPLYDFVLEYTEEYDATMTNGTAEAVTRSVALSFTDEEDNKLGRFRIEMTEYFAFP